MKAVHPRVLDPTGVIWGIKLYQAILARLFDPRQSTVKLKSITVEGPSSLVASWTKEGFLQLPWRPYLTTQHGKTVSPSEHNPDVHSYSAQPVCQHAGA